MRPSTSLTIYSTFGPVLRAIVLDGSELAPGSDGDREHNKLASLSPGIIMLPTKARISMIACGLHHSGTFKV